MSKKDAASMNMMHVLFLYTNIANAEMIKR
jgi:hypothetical protein